jgi:hypothetical protein
VDIIFGIIYTLITSIGALFYLKDENNENKKNRKLYKHPNETTYIDTKGRSRLLSNNELVFYTHDKNGDYILENVSGHVYRNFSEEERNRSMKREKTKALNNNETTYCIDSNKHKNDWTCKGKRFKDFKTGDIYVIRYINYKYYYMNVKNGMIIRKTDWQIKHDKNNIKSYLNDLDIESFNRKQMETSNKQILYRNFDHNYFCDCYK